MALNLRHERFLREYIMLGNKTEAYARVYPNASRAAANMAAARLWAQPKVKKRAQEIVESMIKRADITEDKILADYQHALDLAKAKDEPNSIVNAATAQAKLVGLLRDRVETGEVGDFNDMSTLEEVLEGVSDLVSPEAAAELARAFGITQAAKRTETAPIEDTGHPETGLAIAKPASDAVN